ncbi:MAG: hypothetical protein AAF266_01215 [Planctomycetota bacterium]
MLRFTTLLLALVAVVGCQQEKKVVDVETPIGDVEVTKDEASGDVAVDVNAGADE